MSSIGYFLALRVAAAAMSSGGDDLRDAIAQIMDDGAEGAIVWYWELGPLGRARLISAIVSSYVGLILRGMADE